MSHKIENPQIKVSIENLEVRFGSYLALRNVSLKIFSHEILAVIGPANSGKSTLLLSINRMIERRLQVKTQGQILLDQTSVHDMEDVQDLRRRVGMVFATPIPLPMSIRDNVLFGVRLRKRFSKTKEEKILEEALQEAFLWEEVKDRLHLSGLSLSGGQQQRLCIARTLAVQPEVILFDEPCSGLDPISTAKVEEAMKELKRKHTLVLVTNNTKQAARVGDRTAFLLTGELVEVSPTQILFTQPSDPRTEAFVTGRFG